MAHVLSDKENSVPKDRPETPLLDQFGAAVESLIHTAKERGFVTHDEISASLASDKLRSDQLEAVMLKLDAMGVSILDSDESTEDEQTEVERRTGARS